MTDDLMQVELVAADRLVWSGEAKMVIARTTEGDVGILPNHAPMLSLMVQGIVDVTTSDNGDDVAFGGSVDELARAIDAYEALAFDDVIVALQPMTRRSLDRLAEALQLRDR